MSISPQQFAIMQARLNKGKTVEKQNVKGVDKEGDLHNSIIEYCNSRGWLFFHGSMMHRTKRTIGEPDFEIIAEFPTVYLIECKAKDKKSSQKQLEIQAHARKLGHTVHIVRNFDQFLEIVSEKHLSFSDKPTA